MQKMQEHFSALHCPNTRHPWRNAKSTFTPSMALAKALPAGAGIEPTWTVFTASFDEHPGAEF
ncbi:hypothetical protein [Methylotuvimicrobium buryatense]|uniref:hypothetical protein n=1 Tax=Methylotuvimicrobium buryatense TaxID=95641 RepID=UPI00034A0830|nr:hypothetical protein [Methylotuvimicrobium buryatense]